MLLSHYTFTTTEADTMNATATTTATPFLPCGAKEFDGTPAHNRNFHSKLVAYL